jgi:hypothetical protein
MSTRSVPGTAFDASAKPDAWHQGSMGDDFATGGARSVACHSIDGE